MVGVRLRDLRAFGRWFGALSPLKRALLGLGLVAFVALIVFLLLLVEGLVWAWRKGILTWN